MNPDVNIPENDPEKDREKRPWMYERVFGGRVYKRKSGFFYLYDVAVCIVTDAIVDCLGDVICLNKTWGQMAYSEMRRCLWTDDNKVLFAINQVSARLFGACVLARLADCVIMLCSLWYKAVLNLLPL